MTPTKPLDEFDTGPAMRAVLDSLTPAERDRMVIATGQCPAEASPQPASPAEVK
jgi:hypothetical protein